MDTVLKGKVFLKNNQKMKFTSEQFTSWVQEFCENNPPATKFPTDKELSQTFSISTSTIKRKLKLFVNTGKISRIKGKGTFTAGDTSLLPETKAKKDTALDIEQALTESIYKGDLRVGEYIPQNKLMSFKLSVSPAIVTRALKNLEERDLITRIGNRYLVGGINHNLNSLETKIIAVTKRHGLMFWC